MNGNYLIPANTKRGQLILGLFEPVDLIILAVGIITTVILIALLPMYNALFAALAIMPGLIAGFLVLPVAYYHNVRQLITELIKYFTGRRRYIWKGWCFLDESNYESKNESKYTTTTTNK